MSFRSLSAIGCLFLLLHPGFVPGSAAQEREEKEKKPAREQKEEQKRKHAGKERDAREKPGRSVQLLRQLDEGFSELFEAVAPAVVVVQTRKKASLDRSALEGFEMFLQQQRDKDEPLPFPLPEQQERSEGSGFIIREDGFILTNNHVIEGGDEIMVRLKDGREFDAEVAGQDVKTDIALLKIDGKNLPTVPFGDSDEVRVGQLVFAIGVPFNLDYSFSGGWVSAKGRTALLGTTDPRVMYEDYIQTDAFINPGNSGGPLFDVEGRVIGMNSFINGIGRGLAFAIPSNMLKNVSRQLIETGEMTRPWLGIRMLSREDAARTNQFEDTGHGVVVATIYPDTPAYKSDLRPADLILEVDGEAVDSPLAMQKAILRKEVGQQIKLKVNRGGKNVTVPVTLGRQPKDPSSLAMQRGEEQEEPEPESLYGLQLQELTDELREQLELDVKQGVLVTDVEEGSAAALADVQREDVITEINEKPVRSIEDVEKQLARRGPAKGALLFLNRGGQKTYAVLKTHEDERDSDDENED